MLVYESRDAEEAKEEEEPAGWSNRKRIERGIKSMRRHVAEASSVRE